jgi:hypothetical protein
VRTFEPKFNLTLPDMEKMFTKLTGSILMLVLLLVGFNVKAQTTLASNVTLAKKTTVKTDSSATEAAIAKPASTTETKTAAKPAEDTTWKPQRRVWGYTFGDFYYDAHTDKGNRGAETNYNGVPTYRNAFQFRRVYLGYDYDITKKFKAEFLLASEPNANTGVNGTTSIQNGDNLVDGKMALWIKNANLRVRDLWKGTDFVIGEMSTPGFALNEPGTNGPNSLSEATWSYRSIEKTVTDFHKNNSYDVGAALQGTFDPSTKNFGYVLMVGNNSTSSLLSATNANTGFYKIFYGDLWGKFLNQKLYIDIYADYARTGSATVTLPGQEHNMFKIFASYTTKPITLGAEAYTQKLAAGVNNTTTGSPENATVNALSFWVRGPIVKTLNYFARFDTYNPDTKLNAADVYSNTFNTNYGNYNPFNKETFYTAGVDYNPTKNVHFEPNFWLVNYKDNRSATTTGFVPADHTLVFRLTFFYTFGK